MYKYILLVFVILCLCVSCYSDVPIQEIHQKPLEQSTIFYFPESWACSACWDEFEKDIQGRFLLEEISCPPSSKF